jgi:hypothetical protein
MRVLNVSTRKAGGRRSTETFGSTVPIHGKRVECLSVVLNPNPKTELKFKMNPNLNLSLHPNPEP